MLGDHRQERPCPVYVWLEIEPMASCMGGEYSTTKLYLISPAWVAESPNGVGGLLHCSEEVIASREFRGIAHRDSGLGLIRAQENPAGADTQSLVSHGGGRTCLGSLMLQASKEHSLAVPTEGDPLSSSLEPVTTKRISRVFFWGGGGRGWGLKP